MQIRITGEHSIYAVKQALFEILALAESEHGVRYIIDATLYIRPSNGFGDEVTPCFPNGRPVKTLKDVQRSVIVSLSPRGLNRVNAAAYIGVSPSLFDQMVEDGRMSIPLHINARVVWDIRLLDQAFDNLLQEEPLAQNPWDED